MMILFKQQYGMRNCYTSYSCKISIFHVHHRQKQWIPKMKTLSVGVLWAASLASIVAVIYGLVPYLDESSVPEIPPLVRVAYGAFHQLAWALAVA